MADEEDVAACALESFFLRAQRGQFPELHDRNDLWQVLVTITERKALNQSRDQTRHKRGGGRVRGDSVRLDPGAPRRVAWLRAERRHAHRHHR